MRCPNCTDEAFVEENEIMVCQFCGFKAHKQWFEPKTITNPEDIVLDI